MIVIAAAKLLTEGYNLPTSPFEVNFKNGVVECKGYKMKCSLKKPKHVHDSTVVDGRIFYFWGV